MARIHVTGASGSGTTTLGATLAQATGASHLDSDDFFWLPTDPPYTTLRPLSDRVELLLHKLQPAADWILSGPAMTWGARIEPCFQLIVFLHIDPGLRMERLLRRETGRYGPRIEAGGDMAAASRDFLDWAARYDTAGPEQRSRVTHERWLATQTCPILRLDSARPVDDLARAVLLHPAAGLPT